ncbi:MAG: tRNA lysidine(34) synthetase TilS [Planctomycetota bacterium]
MDDAEVLEAEVARAAGATGLRPGDRVLAAVSGGADSVALAALLVAARAHGLPLEVVVGHVDHGWRGPAEAAADRAVVEALARACATPTAFAGPPDVVRRTEDAARRFRYAALERMAREARCVAVATGHHRRDQAETFLLRLRRGSGPAGLAGIPARRPLGTAGLVVVRPLLDVDPARLRAYLAARGLVFHEDVTNAAYDRDRTRLRARLVAAEARDHALARDLAAAAARCRARLERHEAAVARTLRASLRAHPWAGAVEVALADARRLAPGDGAGFLRVLGRAIAADAAGPWFERVHADLVMRASAGDDREAAVDLPHGRSVRRLGARVLLVDREAPPWAPVALEGEGTARGAWSIARADADAAGFDLDAFAAAAGRRGPGLPGAEVGGAPDGRDGGVAVAVVDAAAAGPRVTCRPTAPDDVLVPLGRAREVSVAAFLGKQGLPAALRRGHPVVVGADGAVLWVVGRRVDARAAVTPRSTRVATLRVAWAGGVAPHPAPREGAR